MVAVTATVLRKVEASGEPTARAGWALRDARGRLRLVQSVRSDKPREPADNALVGALLARLAAD